MKAGVNPVGLCLTFLSPAPMEIPERLRAEFHPATAALYEWETYWVQYPGAERLRLGDRWIESPGEAIFPVRFENQLGLATLQPWHGSRPVGMPLVVEVISPKFEPLEQHREFYAVLLDELFTSAARLPFTFSSATSRGVTAATGSPSPLFAFHFVRHYGRELQSALATVLGRPHRQIHERRALASLALADTIDADVLQTVLLSKDEWAPASGFPLAEALGGFAPARVWQWQAHETADTPENRFVKAFAQDLLTACATLPAQPWWEKVKGVNRERVDEVAGEVKELLSSSVFQDVGPMQILPVAGLLQRLGYRELLALWQCFTGTRQPLFGIMEHSIEMRDIATLYEVWVFFRLVEEMGSLLGMPTERDGLELHLTDAAGLGPRAEARFGGAGTLVYNQPYSSAGSPYESYSVPLRPDFTWVVEGRPEVVLDAKFRLDRPPVEGEEDESPPARGRQADLYKMHAYRDSLGVRAAVVLYPGDEALFYHRSGKTERTVGIPQLLQGRFSGVGAIPLCPHLKTGEREEGTGKRDQGKAVLTG